MHLTPTQEEVVAVLRDTGALRDGHFEDPSGLHSNEYLQVPLALRHYQIHRMLSVGLARLLRANPEIRAITQELSIVTPMTGGLPVAFGVCEALRAKRVYWAERDNANEPLRFRQFLVAGEGRAGGDGGRYSAHRQETLGIEIAAGIVRRGGGGAGGDHLPAVSPLRKFREFTAILFGETGGQVCGGWSGLRVVQGRRAVDQDVDMRR